MTSRRWCFTSFSNEPICQDISSSEEEGTLQHRVRYLIYQQECCPTTSRRHYQGYIEFTQPVRRPHVQRAIAGDTPASVRPARGTAAENRTYCSKEDSRVPGTSPVELGSYAAGGQGTRSDLVSAVNAIRGQRPVDALRTLYEDHTAVMVRYPRGLQGLVNHMASTRVRERPPQVLVCYGPTGSGKTRSVYDNHDLQDVWRAPVANTGHQWFDGYLGQKIALFDDFDGEHPSITVMLQVLDRYPLQVPIKGGFISWYPEIIYITTNISPRRWYKDADSAHRLALLRRITEQRRFVIEPEIERPIRDYFHEHPVYSSEGSSCGATADH